MLKDMRKGRKKAVGLCVDSFRSEDLPKAKERWFCIPSRYYRLLAYPTTNTFVGACQSRYLSHTGLAMTKRYIVFTQDSIKEQHAHVSSVLKYRE